MSSPTVITKAITSSASVAAPAAILAAANDPLPQPTRPIVDPRFVRIDKRQEGPLEGYTLKVKLPGPEGLETLYLTINFAEVCGFDGQKEVCILRPIEFFYPPNQSGGAKVQSWISTTFRSLSRNARGGFLSDMLFEWRDTKGDVVWFGKSHSGKTIVHPSEPAAIAWAIQNQLYVDGYFDKEFKERPVDQLQRLYDLKQENKAKVAALLREFHDGDPALVTQAEEPAEPTPHSSQPITMRAGQRIVGTCTQPHCGGDLVMKDNCPTCLDCGYSKCG